MNGGIEMGGGDEGDQAENIKDVFSKERLKMLWTDKLLCDITLVSKDQEFPAHRAILATASKYFWQKLVHVTPPIQRLRVMVDPNMLRMALEYIYEGRLELKEGNVEKVYLANILLDVTGLTEKCIEFMILHIDDDNWDQRFRFARTQKPPYLIQEVINFISQDYLSYLRSPQFLNMRKEDVVAVLNVLERLNQNEEYIFQCVLDWICYREDERSRDAVDVIKELDYTTLSEDFIRSKFETERVLNSVKCTEVYQEALRLKSGKVPANHIASNSRSQSEMQSRSGFSNQQQHQRFPNVPKSHSPPLITASKAPSLQSTSENQDDGSVTKSTKSAEAVSGNSPVPVHAVSPQLLNAVSPQPLNSVSPKPVNTVSPRPANPVATNAVNTVATAVLQNEDGEPAEKRSRINPPRLISPLVIKAVARKSTGGIKKVQQQYIIEKVNRHGTVFESSSNVLSEKQQNSLNKSSRNNNEATEAIPSSSTILKCVITEPVNPEGMQILYLRTRYGEVRVMSTDLSGSEPTEFRVFSGASKPTLVWVPTLDRLYALGGFSNLALENSSSCQTRYTTRDALIKKARAEKSFWVQGMGMKQERVDFKAVVLGNYIYAFGGAEGPCGNEAVNCAERFSITNKTGRWEEIDFLLRARHSFGAGVINGKIYACGGYGSQDGTELSTMGILNTVECYDPEKDEWVFVNSMMRERWGHAVVVLYDKLYAIGGGGINSHTDPAQDIDNKKSVEVYDPKENSWTKVSSMNRPRKSCSAVALNGKIFVLGGDASVNENELSSSVEMYDPHTDKWTMYMDKLDDEGSFISVAVMEPTDD